MQFSFFLPSALSFDGTIGLQMAPGSSVTTIRSDCAVSVTKFGEKMQTQLFYCCLLVVPCFRQLTFVDLNKSATSLFAM